MEIPAFRLLPGCAPERDSRRASLTVLYGVQSILQLCEYRKRQTKRMDDVFAAHAAGVRSAMR